MKENSFASKQKIFVKIVEHLGLHIPTPSLNGIARRQMKTDGLGQVLEAHRHTVFSHF